MSLKSKMLLLVFGWLVLISGLARLSQRELAGGAE